MSARLILERERLVPIRLVDGPCAGAFAQVAAWGQECWQRIGWAGADRQMWARYDHNPLRHGEYLYSGVCASTDELGRAIAAHKRAGNSYGESAGV